MKQVIQCLSEIIIPNNFVIIEKEDYESLKKNGTRGNCVSAEEFRMKHTTLSRPMFNELILLNPKFRKELDIIHNSKGCVSYPKGRKAGKYYILEEMLAQFISEHFVEIFK